MPFLGLSPKSIAIRSAIKLTHSLCTELGLIESSLYKRLSYQSRVNITLPFSKRKMQLSADGEISKIIYMDGLLGYEGQSTYLWANLSKQADLILDIGAHIGLYSILAANASSNIHIHAFEPMPGIYSILVKNVESSGYHNLIDAHQISIPVDTLDLWSEHANVLITSRSLIKLDVETHEPAVFDGARKALNAGPAILCEVLGTFTEHLLSDFLPASNWHYFWIGPEGPVERLRIIGDPAWKFPNYLFIPKDSPFNEVVDHFKKQ